MAISQISDQNLGKFLQIVFSDGVREQISSDFRDWEMIQRSRVGEAAGRSHRFFFQSSFGPSAIQWSGISPAGDFPASQQVSVAEYEAVFKEINATIEIEYNLWARARKTPEKYAEPLAIEIQSKATAAKRRMSADLHADGTGVIGEVPNPAVIAVSGGKLVVTLSATDVCRGHIGWMEFGDLIKFAAPDKTARLGAEAGGNNLAYFSVVARDRATNKVTLQGYLANGTATAATGAGTIAAGDVVYRKGQPTLVDLTGAIADYNTICEVMAGLESLLANDARVVHGITMQGATAGTQFDCGANPFDVSHIQKGMSLVKTIAGRGNYSWDQLIMSPEAYDALIESRETDRRFMMANDGTRGVKGLVYVHENDQLEMYTSEFCPKNRVRALPKSKASKGKVLELFGSDFEVVKPAGQGSEFMLLPGTAGHSRMIRSYLFGVFALVVKHPAACLTLRNFTL